MDKFYRKTHHSKVRLDVVAYLELEILVRCGFSQLNNLDLITHTNRLRFNYVIVGLRYCNFVLKHRNHNIHGNKRSFAFHLFGIICGHLHYRLNDILYTKKKKN
jgi:hypothetical protein